MRSTALPSREYAAIRTLRVRADAPISVVIGHGATRVSAAVARAEAEALRAHEAGTCHLSEWSCSHCETAED